MQALIVMNAELGPAGVHAGVAIATTPGSRLDAASINQLYYYVYYHVS